MKTKMGFGSKFAYSFFNFAAYKDFLVQGLLRSIFYTLIITVVFGTIGNIGTLQILNDDLSRMESKFDKESPDFQLKDGVFSIDSAEPVKYSYKGDSYLLKYMNDMLIGDILITDTSGTTDSSILDNYDSGTYIDSDSVIFKRNSTMMKTFDFKDAEGLEINNQTVKMNFHLTKLAFAMTLLLINPIISFIGNLFTVFIILGPLTYLLNKNFNTNLTYKNCCTIGFYAMTLPILLESLLAVAGFLPGQFSLEFYIISLVYCSLALYSFRKNNSKLNIQ